jgi:hypothetical protein
VLRPTVGVTVTYRETGLNKRRSLVEQVTADNKAWMEKSATGVMLLS